MLLWKLIFKREIINALSCLSCPNCISRLMSKHSSVCLDGLQIINAEGITESENHPFAPSKEITGGDSMKWLLKSLGERSVENFIMKDLDDTI